MSEFGQQWWWSDSKGSPYFLKTTIKSTKGTNKENYMDSFNISEDREYHNLQIIYKQRKIFSQSFSHSLPTSTVNLWVWRMGEERLKRRRGLRWSTDKRKWIIKKAETLSTSWNLKSIALGMPHGLENVQGPEIAASEKQCFRGESDMERRGDLHWRHGRKVKEEMRGKFYHIQKESKICQLSYLSHATITIHKRNSPEEGTLKLGILFTKWTE